MSLQDKASIVLPKGFAGKASVLECWNPNTDTLVGLSVVRATTATRVNESGLIESVAANVPRRDFTNGGCGELLVEPQRKNLFLNSATGVTQSITVVSGVDYAVSFSGTGSITFSGGATGTLNGTGAGVTDRVSTIITTSTTSVTCTISGTVEYVNFEIDGSDAGVSYATSWIETAGSIVTRNADVISKSSIASLLGQNGGGLYIECKTFDDSIASSISLSSTSSSINTRATLLTSAARFIVRSGGVTQADINLPTSSTDYKKIGARYANNDFALYWNGSQEGTDNSGVTFSSNNVAVLSFEAWNGSSTLPFYGRIRELVIFNEAPTNAQLASITTP